MHYQWYSNFEMMFILSIFQIMFEKKKAEVSKPNGLILESYKRRERSPQNVISELKDLNTEEKLGRILQNILLTFLLQRRRLVRGGDNGMEKKVVVVSGIILLCLH